VNHGAEDSLRRRLHFGHEETFSRVIEHLFAVGSLSPERMLAWSTVTDIDHHAMEELSSLGGALCAISTKSAHPVPARGCTMTLATMIIIVLTTRPT